MIDFNRYSILTFDCYGTLIDWETGIINAMRPILQRHGIEQSDEQILELFGEFETAAQRPPYKTYRDVLATVMDDVGGRLGFTPSDEDRAEFSTSVKDWPAFPDSAGALQSLQKHFKLGILSNIDDDLFAESEKKLGVKFDEIVTAQQVGGYKPDRENFQALIKRINLPKDQILHVAQSLFHDIAPANDAGLTTVWINRRHDREGFGATPQQTAQPDLEAPDLATFAQMVDGARGNELGMR